jgi:hypothetical protein
MGFLSASKDRILENMALAVLNRSTLQPYGRVTALKLNSQEKSLELTLELNGEREPLSLSLQDYEVIQENGVTCLIVKRVATSREWLTALANDFVVGRPFKLPPEAASLIARCL